MQRRVFRWREGESSRDAVGEIYQRVQQNRGHDAAGIQPGPGETDADERGVDQLHEARLETATVEEADEMRRAVRRVLGASIKEAIAARRMLEAQRLLVFTNRSAEAIAYELGFKDAGYFSRAFSKATGAAPGLWRASRRATNLSSGLSAS